jgi:DNA-binding CsgD family transcriptional regulator
LAKVLWFLELIALLFVLPWLPGMPPLNYSVCILLITAIMPLLSANIIWGPSILVQAFRDAFSYRQLSIRSSGSLKVFDFLSKTFPLSGLLAGLVTILAFPINLYQSNIGSSELWLSILRFLLFAATWSLFLLTMSRVLYKVVENLSKKNVFQTNGTVDSAIIERYHLTERETEVAALITQGLTYRATGAILFISPSTVKTHVLQVYQKTGVSNKTELARLLERSPSEG